MAFELPPLPYEKNALEPHISAETLGYHHDKHHAAYVTNINKLIPGTEFESATLEDIIRKAPAGGLFNNGAQIWNHTFYFDCLSPTSGGQPDGVLATAIGNTFGDFEQFKEKFSASAIGNFGCGWTWLARKPSGDLEIINTVGANNPLRDGLTPILTIDIWEHAYYIDYRNARPKYVEAFWNIVNWEFVAQNFAA